MKYDMIEVANLFTSLTTSQEGLIKGHVLPGGCVNDSWEQVHKYLCLQL